jgi:trafficking protein particle complex subunit 11
VNVGELAAFQLSLTSPSHVNLADLPVLSLLIEFVDDIEPVIVRHTDMYSTSSTSPVRRIDLGVVKSVVGRGLTPREVEAFIRWQRRSTLVFTGMVLSDTPRDLKASSVGASRTTRG